MTNSRKYIVLKCVLCILLTFSASNGYSQGYGLTKSSDKDDNVSEIIDGDENAFYAISYKSENSFTLERVLKKDLKRELKTEISIPEIEGHAAQYEEILFFNGHLYVFTSVYDKKAKLYTAYCTEISNEGKLDANARKVDEITESTKNNRGCFRYSLSPDKKLLLAFHAQDLTNGSGQGQLTYKVLDTAFNLLYTNNMLIPNTYDHSTALGAKLMDNQNLYFLEKRYVNLEGRKGQKLTFSACLFNAKENKLYKKQLCPEEEHPLDIELQVTKEGQLLCTGSYAIAKDFGDSWQFIRCIKGVFYELLDNGNLNSISKNSMNIEAGLKSSELYRYHLTSSFILNGDRLVVLCEFQHKVAAGENGDGTMSYTSYFGPVIATSFNLKNDSDSWLQVIENDTKHNTGKCPNGTLSYVLLKRDNDFKLLYNCNREIVIDMNGKQLEQAIFPKEGEFDEAFSSANPNTYFQNDKGVLTVQIISPKRDVKFAMIDFSK